MGLRLYNTMGHTMQDFVPVQDGFVGFYGCGPTVYNYAHIGNLRAYVFLDTLDRTLTYLGYKLKHVMNITDIGHLSGDADDGEDKMLKTAKERHQSVLDIAKFYTDAFIKDIDELNIRHPDVICKATEHVKEMIELIKQIEAQGHTYMAGGNLYYDVTTYPDYGKLANLRMDELKAGAGERDVVVVDENKRNPYDFVLWFTKSKFENQALTWDSPWGRGYPGWHIECSAMSMKYLGKHFDIHTGGIDHIPIHHTNEIAQAEGSFDKEERAKGPWVKYWLHNEFLVIAKDKKAAEKGESEKMSKSSGNFLTLQSLIDKGYDALDYRFFLLGGHYRKQIYFSWDAMDSAKNSRFALVQRVAQVLKNAKFDYNKQQEEGAQKAIVLKDITEPLSEKAQQHVTNFTSALENDLATPKALSILQKVIKDSSIEAKECVTLIKLMDSVLGLKLIEKASIILQTQEKAASVNPHEGDAEAPEIEALIAERNAAKAAKNYSRADEIRDELTNRGIELTDTPNGTVWARK
ncbi:MAG: cysteine--tRNA ligase [Treponema sp.]|nr:cysteine--tRNA ligase [Treponema sp.]